MANKFTAGQKVAIYDGLETRTVWADDGTTFEYNVPDGTAGEVSAVMKGGIVYGVNFLTVGGQSCHALFSEPELQ